MFPPLASLSPETSTLALPVLMSLRALPSALASAFWEAPTSAWVKFPRELAEPEEE